MNNDDLKKLVSRVTEEVTAEVSRSEIARGISISELRDHAKELGGGKLDAAWEISYNTSSNELINTPDKVGRAAWTISYSTSSKAIDPTIRGTK